MDDFIFKFIPCIETTIIISVHHGTEFSFFRERKSVIMLTKLFQIFRERGGIY